jgi:hypothetical protein
VAETSYPRPGHNSGAVNNTEYELLAHPQAADGVVGVPGDTSVVFTDGSGTRIVRVRANKYALVRGILWSSGDTDLALPGLTANSSGSTRIDLVVARLTRSVPSVTVAVVQGTPGAGAPAVTQNTGTTGVYEVPLGEITVLNGASTLAADKTAPREWYLMEQGVVCTAATTPPHRPGRRIWLSDGREMVSTGSAWITTHEDTGWLSGLSAGFGWTLAAGNYRRRNGMVTLNLVAERSGSSIAANTSILVATLPAGFWPTATLFTSGFSTQGHALRFRINPDGTVRMDGFTSNFNSGTFATMATLTFPM